MIFFIFEWKNLPILAPVSAPVITSCKQLNPLPFLPAANQSNHPTHPTSRSRSSKSSRSSHEAAVQKEAARDGPFECGLKSDNTRNGGTGALAAWRFHEFTDPADDAHCNFYLYSCMLCASNLSFALFLFFFPRAKCRTGK